MASEDSRYRDRARRFNLLGESSDPPQADLAEMFPLLHELQHSGRPAEVHGLGSHQRVVFEKRDNDPHEVAAALHRETPHRTAMVVVPAVPDHVPTPKYSQRSSSA